MNDELIAAECTGHPVPASNGIYVLISPFLSARDCAHLLGAGRRSQGALEGHDFLSSGSTGGLPSLDAGILHPGGPHTGLAIKDDPTVAVLQVLNEDSLFFWTTQGCQRSSG
ncbi:MAG: hypothetical protein R3F31_19455 [Verrucomicrobiales bacterium]